MKKKKQENLPFALNPRPLHNKRFVCKLVDGAFYETLYKVIEPF